MAVYTRGEGPVGVLTLGRPERANAYDAATLDELARAIPALAAAHPVVVVCSAGAGSFCAGADLTELRGAPWTDALELRSQRVFTALARMDAITVVAVQGPAVAGGFELALACDLRVVGPRARFWLPETALGLLPSAGGTTRLRRLVGPSRAKEVVLGGRQLTAQDALDWGIAHRLADDPFAEALTWARDLAGRDPVALRRAKERLDADESDVGLLGERVIEAGLYARRR
jgi:enoyl-CoA hydratase